MMDSSYIEHVPDSNELNAAEGITCLVYSSFEEAKELQKLWDSFVAEAGGDIFLTYDWCRIWWKYYGGKNRILKVFVFSQSGKIVGVIPLFFEKLWMGLVYVRVIKFVGSDYSSKPFNLPVRTDCIFSVIQKLLEVVSEYKWDVIHIGWIAGLYADFNRLLEACHNCPEKHYHVEVKENTVQMYVKLAEDWNSHLNTLKSRQRRNIRRSYKEILKTAKERNAPFTSSHVSSDRFNEAFDDFVKMHQSHWQGLGRLGHFGDWPLSMEFHKEVAAAQMQHGRLRFLEMKLGDFHIGYNYTYKFGNQYLAVLNARVLSTELPGVHRVVSTGHILYGEQVKNAIKENIAYVNLMRGKAEFKFLQGGRAFPVRSIYISKVNISAFMRVKALKLYAKILNTLYYKLWFCRIAPRTGTRRKQLAKIWIRTVGFA